MPRERRRRYQLEYAYHRPDKRHHDGDDTDQREGCGHLQPERAEQFPGHGLGEALRQNLAHLRFERSEVAIVRVEEYADDAAAGHGREDVDPMQQPESVERSQATEMECHRSGAAP
jgi:hypothetical protein